jgi:hypothetical protein
VTQLTRYAESLRETRDVIADVLASFAGVC